MLAGMALVQFGGDQKSILESHRIVLLERQGDPLEKDTWYYYYMILLLLLLLLLLLF